VNRWRGHTEDFRRLPTQFIEVALLSLWRDSVPVLDLMFYGDFVKIRHDWFLQCR
jgi:hypothetical protein